MCSLVLNSAYFEGELKFIPEYRFVDDKCINRRVSFRDDRLTAEVNGKNVEEWMISCRTQHYYASFQFEYFVSRVRGLDSAVYLFRWGRGHKILVENRFKNVRFKI